MKIVTIFPDRVIELWNEWEIRVTVLFSLFLQLVLILTGSQRKYTKGSLISAIVWLSYLSADWIATLSLGTLASTQGDDDKDKAFEANDLLRACWAPILLLHLGGPDAITAYALEDNELWLRHLLMLVVQLSVAFYVFLKSWTDTALTFITIPLFVAGITKYAERTWVLRSSSVKQFEDSLLSAPTEVTLQLVNITKDAVYLHEGYFLFGMFKYLYANLSLTFDDAQHSYSIITGENKKAGDAFRLVKVELGFLYDVLYTKASIVYSVQGCLFRAITFLSSISALLSFWLMVDKRIYLTMDIAITYALLIGAVSLELLAVVMIIFSDWTFVWLTRHKNLLASYVYKLLSRLQSSLMDKRRCSRHISQQSLINFCLKEKSTFGLRIQLLFTTYFMLKTYWHRKWEVCDEKIEELVFVKLQSKRARYEKDGFDDKTLNQLLSYRGENMLTAKKCVDKFSWSIAEVEFNHSLLLWHIATTICFNQDLKENYESNPRTSKYLSDYMLYILLMRPFMLPKWIGRIGYLRHTYKEAMRIFRAKQLESEPEACRVLLQACTQIYPLETMKREKKSRSVLFDGCRLAKQLLEREDRWEIVSGVWLEMVTYAASQCGWRDHAQQLRRGGELLTQVSLLMAHMGLSTQFQIQRWHLGSEANEVGWGWGRSNVAPKTARQV